MISKHSFIHAVTDIFLCSFLQEGEALPFFCLILYEKAKHFLFSVWFFLREGEALPVFCVVFYEKGKCFLFYSRSRYRAAVDLVSASRCCRLCSGLIQNVLATQTGRGTAETQHYIINAHLGSKNVFFFFPSCFVNVGQFVPFNTRNDFIKSVISRYPFPLNIF